MIGRSSKWTTTGLLASERGRTFESATYWTDYVYVAGGGFFSVQTGFGSSSPGAAWPFFGFNNNLGTGQGVRAYLQGGTISNATTKAHTVHLRIQDITSNDLGPGGLGPATSVHSGGAGQMGNSYHVVVSSSAGAGQLILRRTNGGAATVLATYTKTVVRGDYVSLAYQYNAGSSRAELAVYHNGSVVGTHNDTSGSRFDMAGVSGKPGMYGHNLPASASASANMAAWTSEWWVTDGFGSLGQVAPPYPDLVGRLQLALTRTQRYLDSPFQVKVLFCTEILDLSWSYARIGGCNRADAKIRIGQALGPDSVESQYETDFIQPSAADWESGDWYGGSFIISLRYDARDVDSESGSTVWSGSISGISFDAATRELSIEADGLSKLLEKTYVYHTFEDVSVRQAIIDVVTSVSKSTQADGKDFPITFNISKILGLSSVMDFRITKDFKWETASSAIESLLSFLPDGINWGVDSDGQFYLQIQSPPYSDDLDLSVPVIFYDAGTATEWELEARSDEVVNEVIVLGTEPDDKKTARKQGAAICEKSSALYGRRQEIQTSEDTEDEGILAKIAQTECKLKSGAELSGTLKIRQPLEGIRSFWQSLSVVAPSISVMHRKSRENLGFVGSTEVIHVNHALRLLGDVSGNLCELWGSTGAQVKFPSNGAERSLSRSWILHVVLKFTQPMSGGTYAFILGRPSAAGALRGWGALYWSTTGGLTDQLVWIQDEGGVSVPYDTGITRSHTTPSATPVHLTIRRRADGTLKIYDGTTNTATHSTSAVMANTSDDWEFWKTTVGSGSVPWDGAMEQFWLYDTAANGWYGDSIDSQDATNLTAWFSRTNAKNLPRNEGCGCLMHIKFNERAEAVDPAGGGTGFFKGYRGISGGTANNLITGEALEATCVSVGSAYSYFAPVSTDCARGAVIGSEQRWGGSLMLSTESCDYHVDVTQGQLDISYSLGARPVGLSRSLEGVNEQLRKQTELLRRLKKDM